MRALRWGLLLAAVLAPLSARAADAGPPRDVAGIRHDLPIVIGHRVTIDDVTVTGDDATAHYRDDAADRIAQLHRQLRRWWVMRTLDAGGIANTSPPTHESFAQRDVQISGDGYDARVHLATNDAIGDDRFTDARLRAPSESESWLNPQADAFAFFSATVASQHDVHVETGTTLDVHVPFALDPSLHYTVSIALTRPDVSDIPATLAHNTLHFVLPPFTLPSGAVLMGEIDGDAVTAASLSRYSWRGR